MLKAWHLYGNTLPEGADFHPLLAEAGKDYKRPWMRQAMMALCYDGAPQFMQKLRGKASLVPGVLRLSVLYFTRPSLRFFEEQSACVWRPETAPRAGGLQREARL